MDWGRRPYSTVVRPFSDSEETAVIHWRIAAPGARCYPDWHAFQSRDWARDFCELTGPGEVYGEPRPYNGRQALPGLLGLTPCGPRSWFRFGQPFDPDAPECERDENGLPDCCEYPHLVTGGAGGGSTSVSGGSPLPPPPPPPPPPPIPPPPPPPPPLPPPCHEFQMSCETAVTTVNDNACPMISDPTGPRWGRYNTQIGVGYGFFISSRPGAYGLWQLFTGDHCGNLISLGGGTNAGGPYNLSFLATHSQVWFLYTSIDDPFYVPSAALTTANGTLCISAWILELNVWNTYTYFETIHRVWFVVPELLGGTEYQILWTQDFIPADGVKVWTGSTCDALFEVQYTHRAIGETRFIPPDTDRYWITIDKPTGGHLEYFIIIAVYAP